MSHKKNQEEASRWFDTGKDDLDTAVILKQNQRHAHACFHAQQAVEVARIIKQIPDDLLKRIEQVENWYNNRPKQEFDRKIALFDLDNTLLVGDCGEALFAQLKIDERDKNKPWTIHKKMIPFTWTEYQETLKTKGKVAAYSKIITCMAGLPLEILLETSQRVMQSDLKYLELEGVKIPVPYPYPPMQALLVRLRTLGYEIYIISATNQYTVRYVAKKYFHIPESNVFGMLPTVVNHPRYGEIIGDEIDGPVTVVEGKVDVYKKNIGPISPLISGGDSTTDIMMLNLTDANGLIIWVGEDENKLASIQKDLTHPEIVYFLKR
ncbi:MAG: HEPN domain-containing protein [Candidatus Aminicenantes bacterium]|jgi:phosphoserine phosphatase